jgi:hypothetical protein
MQRNGHHASAARPNEEGDRSAGNSPRDAAADDLEPKGAREPDHLAVVLGLLFLCLLVLVVVVEAGRA